MKERQRKHQAQVERQQWAKWNFRISDCIDFYNFPNITSRNELNRLEKKRYGKMLGKKFRSYYKAVGAATNRLYYNKSWNKDET